MLHLDALARCANPNAQLIGNALDPYTTTNPDHHRSRLRGRLPGHTRLRIRDGGVATQWFDYVFRSPAELESLLDTTTWTLREVCHDGKGEGYCVRLRI